MNKKNLEQCFEAIKESLNLDYAVIEPDEYGDCNTCVNEGLASAFGIDSKGIYAKVWTTGMNAGHGVEELDEIYIGHDLTEEQGKKIIDYFKAWTYDVASGDYNPNKAFRIRETDLSYREDFVRKFGELFASEAARSHHEGCGVESMEYDKFDDVVIVHYEGGGTRRVNVCGDSLSAIAYDIIRHAL